MDRLAGIAALPEVYRVAIELRDAGASEQEIAGQLGIDDAAVAPLLEIGDSKLARLLAARAGSEPEPA